jgi:ABC-2 type transport system permease protein
VRTVWAVARNDLRQRVRDRSAIAIAFIAPLALTVLIGLIPFGAEFHARFAVADQDGGARASAFVDAVLGSEQARDIVSVHEVDSPATARAMVESGRADAAFVIPEGFSDPASGRPSELTVIRRASRPVAGEIAAALADGFTTSWSATGPTVPTVDTVIRANTGRPLNAASYFAPAMALFFLFFTVGMGARSLLTERSQCTLVRLLVSPASPNSILAGKALASFLQGLLSMLVVLGASALLLGGHWDNPAAVFAIVVAVTLVATSLTWLVATLARTEEQASSYSSIGAIMLALVGGSFFPLTKAPPFLQQAARLTPNGRALEALTDLSISDSTRLAADLVVLAVFACVIGSIAILRSARLVQP